MATEQENCEQVLGEALYNNEYTQTDAELEAERMGLRWLMVLHHAGECYHDCEVREK